VSTTESQAAGLPLSALLSAALVAFTIEFDNAAELQIEHRTTWHGAKPGGVWLVSMAMWLNCMRYAGPEPVSVAELGRLARTGTNLDGMRRWGYITLAPDPAGSRRKPPPQALLVRATRKGMAAREVWQPLTGVIEQRWRDRFGTARVDQLSAALRGLAARLPGSLPDCLPILGHGLRSDPDARTARPRAAGPADGGAAGDVTGLALPWLLARVLLAFALEFETDSPLSLAICANLLRVLGQQGTRVRDLPVLSGVSKEGLAMATGFTGSRQLTVVEADPDGGRWKVAGLTAQGDQARQHYLRQVSAIESRWRERFGPHAVGALRGALEPLTGDAGPSSPLRAGLTTVAANWRAAVRQPEVLPHYPMVLHRGGYPDGS
jgi:hypothetical protein